MKQNNGLDLIAPRVTPVLDDAFRPAVLANYAFRDEVHASKAGVPVVLALGQADGSIFHFKTQVLPERHPQAGGNFTYLERMTKFLLWSRGGWRIYFDGPKALGEALGKHYAETATGKFDSDIIGTRIHDHPLEVRVTRDIPPERANTTPAGTPREGLSHRF